MNDLQIRPVTVDDIPTVLALIRELAEYERLLHEVVASEEMLRQALFGPRPVAECVIAHVAGRPAGFALFFHNFSTFLSRPGLYLVDLYVRPDLAASLAPDIRTSWEIEISPPSGGE